MDKRLESMQFVNDASEGLFNLRQHALIGISPFNSYYSEENLRRLFDWAVGTFKNINIFIPDGISVYTLQAMGYSEDKARKKTRLNDNNLKNKAIRALVANNFSETEAKDKIVFISNLIRNKEYLKFYHIYKRLYETDESVRMGCLASSRIVLSSKEFLGDVSDEAIGVAAKYFLAELPIYLNTPQILNIPHSLYVYKDLPPEFLRNVYSGEILFSSYVSSKQGYLAVNFIE